MINSENTGVKDAELLRDLMRYSRDTCMVSPDKSQTGAVPLIHVPNHLSRQKGSAWFLGKEG